MTENSNSRELSIDLCLSITPDRRAIYVTVIQQYAGGSRGINRWFLGVAPETVVPDGTERELLWSEARRAVRVDPGDEKPGAIKSLADFGAIKSLTLDFVATLSGEFFGRDSLGSYGLSLGRLKAIHDAAEMAEAGNWDPIDSDLELYRWIRPASLERRKAIVDHYRSLPLKLRRAD